jgi:hypothetical protein
MEIKYFEKQNYEMLCDWWKKHNHPVLTYSNLPYGVLVLNTENIPVCASFLYTMDNTDICQIAWTTSNPECSGKEKHKGIELALDSLLILAKKLNKTYILNFSNSRTIGKMLSRRGFAQGKPHTIYNGVL